MRYLHIYTIFFPAIWIGFYLDGVVFAQTHTNGQWFANIFIILVFAWIYTQVSKKIKKLMIFGLVIALGGELLFSIVLGMYTYRLETLPVYVPFGHSIVYASVYYLSKEPIVLKHKTSIINILYFAIIVYSASWLVFASDMFGFLCLLVILWIFKRRPDTKLFFLIMYFAIVYLELMGTYYGSWYWPDIWFDKITWVSSANPPSAISVFYFGFDVGCLWLYKKLYPKNWQRMKRIRKPKH